MLILAGLLLSGFIATSTISYYAAYSVLSEQVATKSLPLTSDNIYSEIQTDLLRPLQISALMAKNTFVRNWLLTGEQDAQQVIEYLSAVQQYTGAVTSFLVSQRTQHYYHPSGVLKTISEEDSQDAWYFRFTAGAEPYEINIDTDTADLSKITIFVNYKVLDQDNNLLGVIGLGLDINQVQAIFENYQNQYQRRVYLVDKAGHLRMHGTDYEDQRPITEQTGLKDVASYVLNQEAGSFYFTRDGREIFLNSRYVPELKWYLLVEEDLAREDSLLRESIGINALFYLLITSGVLLLAYITLSRYQRRLELFATRDSLTGLPNRNPFELHVNKLLRLAERNNEAVSMIVIDVDHFKKINDQHGHLSGDEALRSIANTLQKTIRNSDSICRWGGDEFIVVLPACDLHQAADIAEKIRGEVQLINLLSDNPEFKLSVSLGLAQQKKGDTLPSLLKRADLALYRAKHQGRNQVGLSLHDLQGKGTGT